jgi:hypothetical protein
MGFTNNGLFIINENVDIRGEMSYYEKLEHISDYEENDIFSVIEPTIAVMKHFYDEISYALPTITCWGVEDNRLVSWHQMPNLYKYNSYDDVIKHLSDKSKKYYVTKVTMFSNLGKQFTWSLYVFEKSNISNIREEKLNKILD